MWGVDGPRTTCQMRRPAMLGCALCLAESISGIGCLFRDFPLFSSSDGQRFGRTSGSPDVRDTASDGVVRPPTWQGLDELLEMALGAGARIFGAPDVGS